MRNSARVGFLVAATATDSNRGADPHRLPLHRRQAHSRPGQAAHLYLRERHQPRVPLNMRESGGPVSCAGGTEARRCAQTTLMTRQSATTKARASR